MINHENINNLNNINKYKIHEVDNIKTPKSLLESVNIIYDDDFILLINYLGKTIKEDYKFIHQIVIKLQNISSNLNTNNLNKNNYSKIYESLNHNICLIDMILTRFFDKIQNIFKKMKIIRKQKMKNIIDIETNLNPSNNIFNYNYISKRNNNSNNLNIKSSKTLNSPNNFFDINKNNNKIINKNRYYNSNNSINVNNFSDKVKYFNLDNINKNKSLNKIYSMNKRTLNKSNSDINIIKHNNIHDIKKQFFNENNNKDSNKKNDLIKLESLKNDLITICTKIIKDENINNIMNNNTHNILYNNNRNFNEENDRFLNEDKEMNDKGIIMSDKKSYNDLINDNIQGPILKSVHDKDEYHNIENEYKLMENLKKEIYKKNYEINQLKNKINVLDISLDSSLIKNKELNEYINMLKNKIEKLKISINSMKINKLNTLKELIITHNINLNYFSIEKKYQLKDYIVITNKIYHNLKWFLLKARKNNDNNECYKDYIWVDKDHLIGDEKEFNNIRKQNTLYKFVYHSQNTINKNIKYQNIINNKEKTDNSYHSLLITNIINNEYFIFDKTKAKTHKKNNIELKLNKSFSYSERVDNNIFLNKLINLNKLKINLKNNNNSDKKLDNLTISNIMHDNNYEENSLFNEIKNISNNKKSNVIIHNVNEDNKILNDEAFMKTYNSTELELEAAKNQLTFIKKELRDLKNKYDVIKYSFINLFGKINFPKKYRIEIIQILKLLGVDDNIISFIFEIK